MPGHDDRFHTLGLEWKEGQFLLLGKDAGDEPWLRVPVPDVRGEGPEVTLFLDRQLLIKALRFGLNTLSLRDPVSPLRFHSSGKQMIVMPVRAVAPAADPKPPPAGEPATTPTCPPRADQPQQTPTMQTQPQTNGKPRPAAANGTTVTSTSAATTDKAEARTGLEAALMQVDGIKTSFRDAITGLTKLGDSIRAAMREQKASEKEVHNVRQTLRSLQSVRL